MDFKGWLLTEDSDTPGDKMKLYPPGYGGIGLYSPEYYLKIGDSLMYMPDEWLDYRFVYSKEFKQRFGIKPTEYGFGQTTRKLGSYVGNIRD